MAYSKIGKHIHLIDNRNTDLTVDKLVGLTVDKRFIPSVANIIGTDLSKYKVIRKNQFACSLMQVSRDGKMPVAMFMEDVAIMSPAYPMFEVNDDNELMPEYLMIYLSRSEFDREAVFYAVGGVRGSLDWEDFVNMEIPVPPIEEQRRIVAEYQTVERRIKNNEALIQKLEETAQAIYHHTFVEGIDDTKVKLGTIFRAQRGKPILREQCKPGNIPVIAGGTTPSCFHNVSNTKSPVVTISSSGANAGYVQLHGMPVWSSDSSFIDGSIYEYVYYTYCLLKYHQEQIFNMQEGTGQPHVYPDHLAALEVFPANQSMIKKFNEFCSTLYDYKFSLENELTHLRKLQSLLTSKLA